MNVKTPKTLSVGQAFPHALMQEIAKKPTYFTQQMRMIPGLFKDTLPSSCSVYTRIMLDRVQFLWCVYDYLLTWFYAHLPLIVTTDNSCTLLSGNMYISPNIILWLYLTT